MIRQFREQIVTIVLFNIMKFVRIKTFWFPNDFTSGPLIMSWPHRISIFKYHQVRSQHRPIEIIFNSGTNSVMLRCRFIFPCCFPASCNMSHKIRQSSGYHYCLLILLPLNLFYCYLLWTKYELMNFMGGAIACEFIVIQDSNHHIAIKIHV